MPLQTCQRWNGTNYMQRWQKINDSVCKYVGFYDQDLSQQTSGHSEENIIQVAYLFY